MPTKQPLSKSLRESSVPHSADFIAFIETLEKADTDGARTELVNSADLNSLVKSSFDLGFILFACEASPPVRLNVLQAMSDRLRGPFFETAKYLEYFVPTLRSLEEWAIVGSAIDSKLETFVGENSDAFLSLLFAYSHFQHPIYNVHRILNKFLFEPTGEAEPTCRPLGLHLFESLLQRIATVKDSDPPAWDAAEAIAVVLNALTGPEQAALKRYLDTHTPLSSRSQLRIWSILLQSRTLDEFFSLRDLWADSIFHLRSDCFMTFHPHPEDRIWPGEHRVLALLFGSIMTLSSQPPIGSDEKPLPDFEQKLSYYFIHATEGAETRYVHSPSEEVVERLSTLANTILEYAKKYNLERVLKVAAEVEVASTGRSRAGSPGLFGSAAASGAGSAVSASGAGAAVGASAGDAARSHLCAP